MYVVTADRAASDRLQLPFYEVGRDGRAALRKANLREELATLHFDEIKLRTLRGALRRVLDETGRLGGYLSALQHKTRQFQAAAQVLQSDKLAQTSWPQLPAKILSQDILDWGDQHRPGWVRTIHQTYRKIGQAIGRHLVQGLSRLIRSPLPKESSENEQSPDTGKSIDKRNSRPSSASSSSSMKNFTNGPRWATRCYSQGSLGFWPAKIERPFSTGSGRIINR